MPYKISIISFLYFLLSIFEVSAALRMIWRIFRCWKKPTHNKFVFFFRQETSKQVRNWEQIGFFLPKLEQHEFVHLEHMHRFLRKTFLLISTYSLIGVPIVVNHKLTVCCFRILESTKNFHDCQQVHRINNISTSAKVYKINNTSFTLLDQSTWHNPLIWHKYNTTQTHSKPHDFSSYMYIHFRPKSTGEVFRIWNESLE